MVSTAQSTKHALVKCFALVLAALAFAGACFVSPAFADEGGGAPSAPSLEIAIDDINSAFDKVKAALEEAKAQGLTEEAKERIGEALSRAEDAIADAEQHKDDMGEAGQSVLGMVKAATATARIALKSGIADSAVLDGLGKLIGAVDDLKDAVNSKVAYVPKAATDLVYNGKKQIGVAAGTGFTVSGGSATDAGSYTATATLAEGFFWSDGTRAPVKVGYSIKKAPQVVKVGKSAFKVSAKKVRKKAKKFAVSFTAEGGSCSWAKAKSTVKGARAKATPGKIAIAKNGKITVKKGAKKGTYLLKVAVSAPETANYAAANSTVQLTVKVK